MKSRLFGDNERKLQIDDRLATVERMAIERPLSDKQIKILRLVARSAISPTEKLHDIGVRPSKATIGYGPEFKTPPPF